MVNQYSEYFSRKSAIANRKTLDFANPLAEFELRAGDLRALYNVKDDEVIVLIVGQKVGNKLIVEGEEFHGHQDDPAKPAGDGPKDDAE